MTSEQIQATTVDQSADVQGYVYYSNFTGRPVAWTPGIGPYVPGYHRRFFLTPFGVITSLRK